MKDNLEFRFLRYYLVFDCMLFPIVIFLNWILLRNTKLSLRFFIVQLVFIILYYLIFYYTLNNNKDAILTQTGLNIKPVGTYLKMSKELHIPFRATTIVERFSSPIYGVGMRIQYKDGMGNIKLQTILVSFLRNYETFLKNYFSRLPYYCTVVGFKNELDNLNKYLKDYQIK